MAYEVRDDDEEGNGQGGNQVPPGGNSVPPGSGGLIAPNSGTSSQSDNGAQGSSGNFATFQKYFQANKDQGDKLGQDVAAPTAQYAKEAQDLRNRGVTDFTQNVGTNNFRQEDFDRIRQGLQTNAYNQSAAVGPSINRAAFDFRDRNL